MRRFFDNLSYKMSAFMQGRYGKDELNSTLTGATIVFLILSLIRPLRFFWFIALAAIIVLIFRTCSRNHSKRAQELDTYLKIKNTVVAKFKLYKNMFNDRKTHKYIKCPNCKAMVRIPKPPKGKNIRITCPKCKNSFEKRT